MKSKQDKIKSHRKRMKKKKSKKGSGAARALSTYNPANAREARPMTVKEQRVWFGGGGKRPSFGVRPFL